MNKIAAVIIDTFPDKALSLPAIRRTLRLPNVSRLYILSDVPFYPGATFHKIAPIRSLNEYSNLVLQVLPQLVEEDHFLIIQWDGMPIDPQRWEEGFLSTRCLTIAGGTSEVQRNVIAERILGQPRDPEPGS